MGLLNTSAIPEGKRQQVLAALIANKPNNETIADPDWVDPKNGTIAPQIPKYTDVEWIDEKFWVVLKNWYYSGDKILAQQATTPLKDIRNE